MATFHAFVCMLEWLACLAGFVYGLKEKDKYPWLWYASLLMIFIFPILNEMVLCLKGACCRSRVLTANYSERHNLKECIPIVYSPKYNIHAFGIEKLHPFDASKYRRVWEDLIESETIEPKRMKIH